MSNELINAALAWADGRVDPKQDELLWGRNVALILATEIRRLRPLCVSRTLPPNEAAELRKLAVNYAKSAEFYRSINQPERALEVQRASDALMFEANTTEQES